MPTTVGPNTKGEENLVFGYDLGDVSNSYKGEPTTNLYTTLGFSNYQAEGGHTAVRTTGPAPLLNLKSNYDYHTITTDANWVSESKRLIIWPNSGLAASTAHYVSFWARVTSTSTAQIGSAFYGNSINNTLDLTTEWQYFKFASTTHSTYRALEFGSKSGAIVFQVAGLQIELKSHATPYVNGTRSATQGLIDLTGNSTIDLTNVSFDSNAQMTFDGTNDYASVGYSTAINTPNGATYEIMLYPEGGGEFLSRGKSDSGTDPDNPRFYLDNTGYLYFDWSTTGADTYAVTPGSVVTFNQWHHVVGVAQPGDQLRIYVNGEETSYSSVLRTVPSSVPNTEDPIIIGGVSWIPRYFDGKVAMVKLYNRALTASEIQANYNAVKGRFNI